MQAVRQTFILSVNLPYYPEIFHTFRNIFHTVNKYFTLSRKSPSIFQTIRHSCILSINLPNCPVHFPDCQKSFTLSRYSPDLQKSSRFFFCIYLKSFLESKNFPATKAFLSGSLSNYYPYSSPSQDKLYYNQLGFCESKHILQAKSYSMKNIFSRPGRSQGMLHKQPRH